MIFTLCSPLLVVPLRVCRNREKPRRVGEKFNSRYAVDKKGICCVMRPRLDVTRKRFYISHGRFAAKIQQNGYYFYVRFFHSLERKKKKQSTNAFEFTYQPC